MSYAKAYDISTKIIMANSSVHIIRVFICVFEKE